MIIKTLGAHNCESENTRLTTLLIDNIIAIDAGAITSSLSFQAQLSLKALFITHQHYDHIKDVPTLAFNFAMKWEVIDIYSTEEVYQALSLILGSKLYPNFLDFPETKPTIRFDRLKPYETRKVAGYEILALPVNHSAPSVGYQVTSSDGATAFFTGDTGPGLEDCWERISPRLVITEVSAPDSFQELYHRRGHFTPGLLKEELTAFRKLKGYLPQVVTVHMNPGLEQEIIAELDAVGRDLGHPITPAREGMEIRL